MNPLPVTGFDGKEWKTRGDRGKRGLQGVGHRQEVLGPAIRVLSKFLWSSLGFRQVLFWIDVLSVDFPDK